MRVFPPEEMRRRVCNQTHCKVVDITVGVRERRMGGAARSFLVAVPAAIFSDALGAS